MFFIRINVLSTKARVSANNFQVCDNFNWFAKQINQEHTLQSKYIFLSMWLNWLYLRKGPFEQVLYLAILKVRLIESQSNMAY